MLPFWKFNTDEERRVRDEQERIQGIRDELKDKTLRINELEVNFYCPYDYYSVFFLSSISVIHQTYILLWNVFIYVNYNVNL